MTRTIEIPADAKTVTLELEKRGAFTLRSLLPQVRDEVELVVADEFGTTDTDLYRLRAGGGAALLRELARSRVVDGERILGLTPSVRLASPVPTLVNGSLVLGTGTGFIQLTVTWPRPDEEG